jgi:hypothetical protein
MGLLPGRKKRKLETDEDIKAGKQAKLDVALFSKKSGPSSDSTSSSVPTSVVSQVIRYIPVHEIQDSPDSDFAGLSKENYEFAVNETRKLIEMATITSSVVKRRNDYSESQRESVIKIFETLPGLCQEKLRVINGICGYEKIRKKNITDWLKSKKRAGRQVSREFEREVGGELILYRVMKIDDVNKSEQAEILANSIYSYECVRCAAKNVFARNKEKWEKERLVKELKFSDKWVSGFLRRLQFPKRRVTTVMKVIPPVEVVRSQMDLIKDFIVREAIPPERIFNADETGVNWAPELQHHFVPADAVRAVAPPGYESGRFTALLGSNANGGMLPFYFIIKCSCKSTYDLRSSTILNKFFGEENFCKPSDGWQAGTWETTLSVKGEVKSIHRPYLLNTNTLDLK